MGQVHLDCEFGKLLRQYASNPAIKSICEVGAWDGQGTTYCIMDGIVKNNNSAVLYSYESNIEFYNKSVAFWKDRSLQPKLIYGTLHRSIMSKDDVKEHPIFNDPIYSGVREFFDLFYDNDVKNMNTCEIVTNVLPDKLDMIVLDGGEWTSFHDYNVLKDKNPTVIALDDTNVIKNYYLKQHLISNGFKIVHSGNDRNGWAILEIV
jgi:hypothetical protein